MHYREYPEFVVEDIVRLRRRLDSVAVPPRRTDHNFILGTWNIRSLGGYFDAWGENPDSPKRNLRGLALIAEVIRRFDVVAIQEVKRETTALRLLAERFLGPDWSVMMSDVTAGDKGNTERAAYLYDRRRVTPSGLAGEIVLPPTDMGDPQEQFDRTPYLVGFVAGGERFALLTAHIRYGEDLSDRIPELRRLAKYTAEEIRDRSRFANAEEANLIVLGDFNVIPEDKDVWSPPAMQDDALMQPASRDAYRRLLADGWTDALDTLNPRGGVWTFWDYQRGAWQRDHGFRIDHCLLSPELADRLEAAGVDKDARGKEKASDHAPVWIQVAG